MITVSARPNGEEARMWAAALCVSVVLNLLILAWISYHVITREVAKRKEIPQSPTPETVVTIFPDMVVPPPKVEDVESRKDQVVRTSPDQETADPPASRRYIGERNTKATSDRAADPEALEMPSQAGRVPEEKEQHETTESDYQDGRLVPDKPSDVPIPSVPESQVQPNPLQPAQEMVKGDVKSDEGEADKPETAVREKLLESPDAVETPVKQAEVMEDVKPREEKKAREGKPDGIAEEKPKEKPKETSRPQPVDDPAFRGNQSKTRIQGSISRTGRSALDVEDTPMGRYQAQISRAVEQEWQRNVLKHRDFITPGYLTVRFFVQADGKVRSVNFIGEVQTGEIQKGFTLNSIREADIPAMPPAVKKEMGGDALELIFNFYF